MHKIVENGTSQYHIVSSQISKECERFAASELQKYIYESTNTLVPYFSDKCEKRGKEIIIDVKTRDAKKHCTKEELECLGEEGFLIKSVGDDILITGNTPKGTLYGVYGFLEKFLGFRAFTKDVEKINHSQSLEIPEINIFETPDFEYRDAYFRFAFDGGFSSKNRLNSTLADLSDAEGGRFKFYNFHHSFDDLVPRSEYFETHPEYFSMIDGERKATQLCLSNPDVLEIATKKVFQWIEENPNCRIFSVAQNDEVTDNPRFCECEECRKIDEYEGAPSGSVINFVNKIAERVEKVYPHVLIHTFAFTYSRFAPKHIKPRKNVIVRLCNIECEWGRPFSEDEKNAPSEKCREFIQNIKDWTKISDRVYIWDYAVNFSNYLQPFPNFYQMAQNIRLYKKLGVGGVLEQGNFSYGGGAAQDDLKAYLIAKLLWNSSLDEDKIIDEFLEGVYGKGAPYIKEYILLWTKAVSDHKMTLYDYPDAPYVTDELIEESDRLFSLAEEKETGDTLKRIQRERLSVEYMKTVRIKDDEKRTEAVDAFAEKVKSFKITEIMERLNLYDSFEFMKRGNFARDRKGFYVLYYIVR